MTTISARQPRGIPVGGQFAATTHAEPTADLALDFPRGLALEQKDSSIDERSSQEVAPPKGTHEALMSDALTTSDEARFARAAIQHSLISGEFGKDTLQVSDLAQDDRLVRLAVDRYVVTESQEPGAFRPVDAGHRLGRILVDLQDEDIEDAVYALKDESV